MTGDVAARKARFMLLAIAAGAIVVMAGKTATDLLLGEAVFGNGGLGSIDGWVMGLLQALLASLPMILLARQQNYRFGLWAIAIALTAFFQAYFVWQIWKDSLGGFEGGANIGLGWIMMAAPFLIILVLKAAAIIRR